MDLQIRLEIKIISDCLKTLGNDGIIRSNNLVGDLGEYYCQELFNIVLCPIVNKGFDGYDSENNKVEIKTRRLPSDSAKIIFRSFDFDYCLFVELDDCYNVLTILKINVEDIKNNVDKIGDRMSAKKLKTKTNALKLL